jgi:hypothetical protein
MTRRAELAPPCWAISGPWAIRATTYANSTACVIYLRRVARYAVPISRVGRRIYFDQHIPRVIDKRLVAAYIGLPHRD